MRRLTPEKFWSKVFKTTHCWFWLGLLDKDGYGKIKIDGKTTRAHRHAWELMTGEKMPSTKFACHSCDTPNCVRPDHIWTGSPKENSYDSRSKGRATFGHNSVADNSKPQCKRGHDRRPENVGWAMTRGKRVRVCKPCGRIHQKKRREKLRADKCL